MTFALGIGNFFLSFYVSFPFAAASPIDSEITTLHIPQNVDFLIRSGQLFYDYVIGDKESEQKATTDTRRLSQIEDEILFEMHTKILKPGVFTKEKK